MIGGSGCQGKRSCQGRAGGDDGDAHVARQSGSSPLVPVSAPPQPLPHPPNRSACPATLRPFEEHGSECVHGTIVFKAGAVFTFVFSSVGVDKNI